MNFQVGNLVTLLQDDQPENQRIIHETLIVTKIVTRTSPFWMEVLFMDGKTYSVRGSDCRRVKGF
jgi:hypothetical protein